MNEAMTSSSYTLKHTHNHHHDNRCLDSCNKFRTPRGYMIQFCSASTYVPGHNLLGINCFAAYISYLNAFSATANITGITIIEAG